MRIPAVLLATAASVRAFGPHPHRTAPLPPGRAPRPHRPPSCRRGGSTSARGAVLYPVSGVDALPVVQQQLVFVAASAGLGAGTVALRALLGAGEDAAGELFTKWRGTWPLLGVVYVAAGAAHFGVPDAFISIYPPQGTWGLWYLPGSPEFQVAWTGVAEFAGGAGLLAGAAGSALAGGDGGLWSGLKRTSAACLAALTVAVSPANFYMYSHGAIMVGAGPDAPVGLEFHAVRFVAQILILGILTGIAAPPGAAAGGDDGREEPAGGA